MTDITELAQLRDRTVDYPYYLVECDCGKIYPSSELSGGEPMGDSGDYSDCYCPHCGEGEEHFAECADPETAWKAQQDKIDALVEALEKAQLRIDEMESDEVRQRLANAEYQLYMAELAKNNLRASRKAQFRKRKAAEKRIAELESRTVNVKLPTAIEPAAFSPWVAKAFYQFHKDTVKSCFAVFSDACAAAGIKVEAE
ncbi:hypothetical protein [Klebsiella pneumoniae]|uniref:hypothetical protein n=1 Tax=Klebsiella pneumoniae TaxID=573 RepID=UPI00191A3797|nr:hypothetical protein [Klebsiella pneumoniae]